MIQLPIDKRKRSSRPNDEMALKRSKKIILKDDKEYADGNANKKACTGSVLKEYSVTIGNFTSPKTAALYDRKNMMKMKKDYITENENESCVERRGRKKKPKDEDEQKDLFFEILKRRIENKIQRTKMGNVDDKCFKCGIVGELLYCDNNACPRGYHLPCVYKTEWPTGRWLCPWHYCLICQSKRHIIKCFECVNAYCARHYKGNIFKENEVKHVCNMHKSRNASTLENLKTRTTSKPQRKSARLDSISLCRLMSIRSETQFTQNTDSNNSPSMAKNFRKCDSVITETNSSCETSGADISWETMSSSSSSSSTSFADFDKELPTTNEMMEEIRKLLETKNKSLVKIEDISIEVEDINTLQDDAWLNDRVINAYMHLIQLRGHPEVVCFNTHFYQRLLSGGHISVSRWTKKIDIFRCTTVIIPIHLDNHWCLIGIKPKEKFIKYYDSLGSPNVTCLYFILQYLIKEYEEKRNGVLNVTEWQLINVPVNEIPKQNNYNDCGVFVCTFAEYISRNATFNFTQEDMSYFRKKMMYEILRGRLLL